MGQAASGRRWNRVFAVTRWIRAKRTAASPGSWQDWTVERGGDRGLLTG